MSRRNARAEQLAALCLVAAFAVASAGTGRIAAEQKGPQDTYRPKLAVPETLQPFLQHLEPGTRFRPSDRQRRSKAVSTRCRTHFARAPLVRRA